MTVEMAWTAEGVDETVRPEDAATIREISSALWRWAEGHGPRA